MYRIAIATRGLAVEYFTYLNRLAEPLSDYSIRLVAPEVDHDLLFTDDASLLDRFDSPEEIDRPIVVFERKDAAVVQPKLRRWLAHPNVKLWLKTTVFRNPPDNNLSTATGHLHVDWIRAAEGQDVVATRRPIEIATSDLSKIRAFQPVFMMERMDEARKLALTGERPPKLEQRPIDLLCAGRSDHGWEDVTRHRQRANLATAALSGRNTLVGRGRIFDAPEYLRILRNSRMLLSPFGHGEMNWKDWEAVMNETGIIKPRTAHVTTALYDIYAPGRATITCSYDFSDLPTVVDEVMANLITYQGRVAEERAALLACFSSERLAEQFASMAIEALS